MSDVILRHCLAPTRDTAQGRIAFYSKQFSELAAGTGEVVWSRNPDTEEEQYIAVIRSKTAKLFEAATQLGAESVDGNDAIVKLSLVGVGMRSHAGIASRMFKALAEEIAKGVQGVDGVACLVKSVSDVTDHSLFL